MNTSEYLRRQGWRGSGFSLDHSDRGLARPLLIAHKSDLSGLGTKKNDFSEQWWDTAFDRSLRNVGRKPATAPLARLPQVQDSVLYSRFIKADTLVSEFTASGQNSGEERTRTQSDLLSNGSQNKLLGVAESHESGPVLGGPVKMTASSVSKSVENANADKKRKRETEVDLVATDTPKGVKHKKRSTRDQDYSIPSHGNYEVHPSKNSSSLLSMSKPSRQPVIEQHPAAFPIVSTLAPKQSSKESAKEVRKRRKGERSEKAREGARRNKEEREAREAQAAADGTCVGFPVSSPEAQRELRGPPHAESIMGRLERGGSVNLPGDSGDPDWLRAQLIQSYERNDQKRVKRLVNQAYPTIDPNDQASNHNQTAGKKVSYKAAKYDREKAKRVAKRDARRWVNIRANTHLYRPDGTYIHLEGDDERREEIRAKRQADKTKRQQTRAEKVANRELKEQTKIERKAATKLRRAEKKRQNHMLIQAHIAAKLRKQKEEKDHALVLATGMTDDAYAGHEGVDVVDTVIDKHKAKPTELGMTYKDFTGRRQENSDESKATSATHDWQQQDPEDSAAITDVDSDGDSDHSSSDADSDSSDDSTDLDLSDCQASLHTTVNNHHPKSDTTSTPTHSPVSGVADFIPLGDVSELRAEGVRPGFILDLLGDPSQSLDPNVPKRVKDMTKAERRARLEGIRKRREEKKLTRGETTLSKKERRKLRAQRKEELINKMTNDLLDRKKREMRESGETAVGSQGGQVERKKMRREARRIMRGMKKGKIPQEELMPGWEMRGRRTKAPRMRGNGGREPKTRADLWK